jgi:carboxymethylenebutenolidase
MSSDPKGLGAMFDAHTDAEFKTRDIEATMATMDADPHVTHVPTMTGGFGRDPVRRFYETWFIGHWPKDTVVRPISRTVGENQVVDEVMISFTHDRAMPALLPGVEPTGRKVTIPFVVVVGFKEGKIAFERIYWDQASMLVQVGLLDKRDLPVTDAEQAARLLDPSLPSNTLIPER